MQGGVAEILDLGMKIRERKAPWDIRVIQGLRLYLSRWVGNLAEYLKVSLRYIKHGGIVRYFLSGLEM
jgi:hypothetical protein